MKTIRLLFFVVGIGLSLSAPAQIAVSLPLAEMESIRTDEFNLIGKKMKISAVDNVNTGSWETAGDVSTWKLMVEADNCDGIIVYFDELILPTGSEIFAYNPDRSSQTTKFTRNDNKTVKTFALPAVFSRTVIVEACIPSALVNDFKAGISEIGCIVKRGGENSEGFGDAPECYININSPDGLPWQDQKKAVALFTYTQGGEIGNCTGTLVNNTVQDDRNLFLSAQHCAMSATPEELGQAIFYFNYESPDGNNPSSSSGLMDQTVIGCTMVAASGPQHPQGTWPDGSDFRLLELNPIPVSYNVYYAGWNRNDIGPNIPMPGAIIHHPLSDIKKISFIDSFTPSFTSPFSDFSAICIQSSGTGGTIEPNSSGSAVFDNQNRIIGTCSYGGGGCVIPGNINSVGGGKFWFHWDQNGTSADRQLKPWLDPLSTGVMAFPGKYPNNTGITHTVVKNTFSIYPNPASDNFKILTDKAVLQVTLYNILGEKVGSWKNTRFIPVQQLPPGVYFTIIKFPREIYTVKIIKRN